MLSGIAGSYLPTSIGSYSVSREPVIVDLEIYPELESDPVEVQGYEIPSGFKTFFLVKGIEERNWSLELRIKVDAEGTPRVTEAIIRGQSDQKQIWIEGAGDYRFKRPHEGVRRFQFEIVEQHFASFLVASLQIAVQALKWNSAGRVSVGKVRNIGTRELKDFERLMRDRVAKTTKTMEWAKEVLKVKKDAKALATQTRTRDKSNKAVRDHYGIDIKTAEAWVRDAQDMVSASKAGKKKTLQKKGKAK
jgi:hypothetical protein